MFQALHWLVVALAWQGAAALDDVDISITSASPVFTVRGQGDSDVCYFYGIPFSKARTPPNRFALPEEYVHTAGETYMAKDQKHECVQKSGEGSEDCLYLDIYMPAVASPSNTKPVLVWIHGGAWQTGSKNEYSGKFWASQQWTDEVDRVVVVTVNYRMNILGFPDMDGTQVNLAMHDNIAALTWVKNHIGNFGGDNTHTTIYGESAGSMQTVQLWASPAARGLFQRAIAQSPYIWSYKYGTPIPDEATGASKRAQQAQCMQTAKASACASLAGGEFDPACTAQTPTLAELVAASCFGRWYGPMSDGGATISDHFHKDMCGTVDLGYGVPLLVGFNALEINLWSLMGGAGNKIAQMRTWIEHLAPLANQTSLFQCLGDMYRSTGKMQDPAAPSFMPALTEQGAQDLYAGNGVFFNMATQTLMQLPNVHMFVFNESAAHMANGMLCSNPLGAHSCEVGFVISEVGKYNVSTGGIDNLIGGDPMDTVVQQNMRKVWAKFALSGNPGWAHDEVGAFENDKLVIHANGAVFDPSIKNLLNKLMCHPAAITPKCDIPHTYTCGEVKGLFRNSMCCGNPSKTFHFPSQ